MAKRFDDGPGPSQRQLRVGELLRRRLAEVLARGEVHDPELERHTITVGEVRATQDLRIATAYVLPLGGGDAEGALKALAAAAPELRRAVSKGLSLKYAPELRFRLDDTFDKLDAARRMFADDTVRRDADG